MSLMLLPPTSMTRTDLGAWGAAGLRGVMAWDLRRRGRGPRGRSGRGPARIGVGGERGEFQRQPTDACRGEIISQAIGFSNVKLLEMTVSWNLSGIGGGGQGKEAADVCGGVGGAEAVVDIDDGDAGAAGIEHAEQGGDAAKTGAVTDAGGNGDDGLADEAGDGAGEGAFHAGGDDDRIGGLEAIPYGKETVDARDANVADAIDGAAEGFEGDGSLLGDGDVRGAGADDGDDAGQRWQGPADDGDAAGDGIESGIGELGDEGLEVLRDGACAEDDAIGLEQGAGDGEDLPGELAGAEDDLREAAPGAALGVHTRKT